MGAHQHQRIYLSLRRAIEGVHFRVHRGEHRYVYLDVELAHLPAPSTRPRRQEPRSALGRPRLPCNRTAAISLDWRREAPCQCRSPIPPPAFSRTGAARLTAPRSTAGGRPWAANWPPPSGRRTGWGLRLRGYGQQQGDRHAGQCCDLHRLGLLSRNSNSCPAAGHLSPHAHDRCCCAGSAVSLQDCVNVERVRLNCGVELWHPRRARETPCSARLKTSISA